MYIYFKINLLSLLKYNVIISIFLIRPVIFGISIPVAFAKNPHYLFEFNQQIKQLNQISDAHSQCLIQLQQQLSENQQDLDILRGRIQDIQHHISEIVRTQQESSKKIDIILNNNKILNNNNINNNMHNSPIPIDLETHINNSQIEKKIINTADADYKSAVALVLEKKQYNQAIQKFQKFIEHHPKSDYQPNAHYWLGQLYYNQGNKHDASFHFALVVKNYPKSSKAPDALLKIGIIMQETNETDKAKTIYRQIGKLYPNTDASKQAQRRLLHI